MGWGDIEDAPLLYPLITMVYITLEDVPLLYTLITMVYITLEDAPLLYTLITMVYITLEDVPLYLCGNERLLSFNCNAPQIHYINQYIM